MEHVILVHGMHATAGSWFNVPTLLGTSPTGTPRQVKAITLPGHDGTPNPATVSMDDYVSAIGSEIPPANSGVSCTLIGHSMGGFVISQAASEFHAQIKRLIYVTAMLPTHGQTIDQLADDAGTDPEGIVSLFLQNGLLNSGARGEQPTGPLSEPFKTSAGFKGLDRHYIVCTQDSVLSKSSQEKMIRNSKSDGAPLSSKESMDSDHLPQLTDASDLVKLLNKKLD